MSPRNCIWQGISQSCAYQLFNFQQGFDILVDHKGGGHEVHLNHETKWWMLHWERSRHLYTLCGTFRTNSFSTIYTAFVAANKFAHNTIKTEKTFGYRSEYTGERDSLCRMLASPNWPQIVHDQEMTGLQGNYGTVTQGRRRLNIVKRECVAQINVCTVQKISLCTVQRKLSPCTRALLMELCVQCLNTNPMKWFLNVEIWTSVWPANCIKFSLLTDVTRLWGCLCFMQAQSRQISHLRIKGWHYRHSCKNYKRRNNSY